MKKLSIRFAFAILLGLLSSQSYATGNDNPTGVTGQYNGSITTAGSYDPYTGNATRTITDLSVTGAVGAYPLRWARTLNTRNVTAPKQVGRGGWTHSYQWSIYLRTSTNPDHWNDETPDYYEGPDAVVYYPDGRQVWFEGAPGYDYVGAPEQDTSVLLKHVGGGNYDLYLPDGGIVQFELGPYLDGTVMRTGLLAQRIKDPYGVVTTLHRDSAGRPWRVQEQAGRFLQINYTNNLITSVQAFAGEGNLLETVSYVYGYLGTYLTQVNYDDFTHAFYTYQGSNHDGTYAALIRTCDDVRYAGPMGKIEYVYMPLGAGIDFGQIKGEKYPGMSGLVSQISYPAYNCCAWNDPAGFVRTETRADSFTRTFQYQIGGGELTGFSDFKNQWSYTTRVVVAGNPFARRINTDARTNPTTIEKTFHGKTNRLIHPDGSYQAFVYEYVNGYPYYVLIHGDELGRNTFYERDENHRVKKIWYAFDDNNHSAYPTEEFTYNQFGQILTHTLSSGGMEAFEYDNGLNNRGLKTKHTDPLGNVTRFGYYPIGSGSHTDRLLYVEDPHLNRTWFDYNLRGQVTRVMHQDATYTQSGYNPDGTLAWTADENHPGAATDPNQRTRYSYDEYKRVLSVTNPMGHTTTNGYQPWSGIGSLSHTTSSVHRTVSHMGKEIHIDYDANFRRTISRAAPGTADDAWTFFEYDEVGNLTKTIDPRSKVTLFGYDNRNRQIWMDNAIATDRNSTGHTMNSGYDAVGNKIRETRADDAFRTWNYEPIIPLNRLLQTVDWRMSEAETPLTTSYARDVKHLTEWITDAKGAVYTFGFDALHRKTSATYPTDATGAPRTETWHYDAAGNMDVYHNPAGQRKNLWYDERNRQRHTWWDGGAGPNVVTNYDPANRMTNITTNNGETVVTFGYDNANRQIWEEQTVAGYPTRRVEHARDADGNAANTHIPGYYLLWYHYNQRNQLDQIQDAGGTPWINFSYDAAGNLTKRQAVYGGVNDSTNAPSQHYDALNRPTMWEQTGAVDFPFARSWYQYDKVGREVATWRDEHSLFGERFSYNVTGQVTKVSYQADQVWTGTPLYAHKTEEFNYTADKLNRQSVTENGVTTGYVPAPLNQYTGVGGAPIGYDGNFNLTSFDGAIFTYDAQNRLVSASRNGNAVQFVYDGLGRCLKRTTNGFVLILTYDGWKALTEWAGDGSYWRFRIYGAGPDEILWHYDSRVGYIRVHSDVHGNVVALLDWFGAGMEKYTYDAFGKPKITDWNGNERAVSNVGNRFMYTGRDWISELGIYEYRNRMYHPKLGRFLQTDPIGFDAGDMNLFRYCGDDPVNRSDPTGLDWAAEPDQYVRNFDNIPAIETKKAYGATVRSEFSVFATLEPGPHGYSIKYGDVKIRSRSYIRTHEPKGYGARGARGEKTRPPEGVDRTKRHEDGQKLIDKNEYERRHNGGTFKRQIEDGRIYRNTAVALNAIDKNEQSARTSFEKARNQKGLDLQERDGKYNSDIPLTSKDVEPIEQKASSPTGLEYGYDSSFQTFAK